MTRILFTLALFSLVLLVVAMTLGLGIGDLYDQPSEQTLRWATVHRLTGVAAALVVVLVECIVVTYFIGTSRWCKEVVATYELDPAIVERSARLKRRAFPWALAGMLAVVGVVALGGAADPATGRPDTQAWADYHLLGGIAGICLIAWSYFAAWNHILAHHAIIQGILTEVGRIRHHRGLDAEPASATHQGAADSSAAGKL